MLQSKYAFEALGTSWEIVTNEPLTDELQKEIDECIEAFDATYSRFTKDSLVTKMKQASGRYDFPTDFGRMFNLYHQLYVLTEGRMTPLIGEVLERAGYDAEYSFQSVPQKAPPKWDDVMTLKESTLITSQPITLDVGAAGKGQLVDILAHLLKTYSIDEFVIDASGDIIRRGKEEYKIGLEHPADPAKVIGVVNIRNQSLCASASNRRAWGEGMHHIIDPETQRPVTDVIATWVIADSTMLADALATALFFSDPQHLAGSFEYEYVRMHQDGSLDYSHGFGGELF